MTAAISPPVRVFVLVAALAATGLAAAFFLLGRSAGETEPAARAAVVTRPAVPTTASASSPAARPSTAPKSRATVVRTTSGFPAPVDRALRRRAIVVIAVYTPGADVDAFVRREARAGAEKTAAGYVAIAATSERLVQLLVAKVGVLPNPAVVVVRRPGDVVVTLGVTDRDLVAQAVAQAKR